MLKIVLFLLGAAFIFMLWKYYDTINKINNDKLSEINTEYAAKQKELEQLQRDIDIKEQALERSNNFLQQQVELENDFKQRNAEMIQQDKDEKIRQAQDEYDRRTEAMKDAFRQLSEYLNEEFGEQAAEIRQELNGLVGELDATRIRVSAINDTIRTLESEELEKDFYKIKLTRFALEDIQYLLSIEDKVHNKEVLRKLIWSTYLQPAFNDMTKRVLNNQNPSGIYKITDSNSKAYIGRSTKIKTRWAEHIKSSLGIGSIAHYGIHDALRDRGWNNFTFEIVETAAKEELSQLEKYYIDYFETNTYGYNKNTGG